MAPSDVRAWPPQVAEQPGVGCPRLLQHVGQESRAVEGGGEGPRKPDALVELPDGEQTGVAGELAW